MNLTKVPILLLASTVCSKRFMWKQMTTGSFFSDSCQEWRHRVSTSRSETAPIDGMGGEAKVTKRRWAVSSFEAEAADNVTCH